MKPILQGPTAARIRTLLSINSATAFTIECALHVSLKCARANLKALHDAREIRISSWWRGGERGPWVPVYSLGNKADKWKPKPITDAYRHKLKRQDPTVRMDELVAKRAARARKASRSPKLVMFPFENLR